MKQKSMMNLPKESPPVPTSGRAKEVTLVQQRDHAEAVLAKSKLMIEEKSGKSTDVQIEIITKVQVEKLKKAFDQMISIKDDMLKSREREIHLLQEDNDFYRKRNQCLYDQSKDKDAEIE